MKAGPQKLAAATQAQVENVGSEEIYRRVNNKLAQLEVDPWFYWEQLSIYRWREYYLKNDGFSKKKTLN